MLNCTRTVIRNYYSKVPLRQRLLSRKTPKSKTKRIIGVSITAASTVLIGSAANAVYRSGQVIDQDPSNPFGDVYQFQKVDEDGDSLPLVYDVKKIEKYWKKRTYEILKRTGEIIHVLGPYVCKLVIWEYFIRRKIRDHEDLQKKYAIKLRECLTDLGPCFIKFGQAMSIRPDLLPSTFVYELQKLCDAVPSFPTSDAISVIESELG